MEIQNIRVSMEKALRAKEELEKMRRDLLREMEQIQSNLEIEIKLKIKKKLEMEYKELEYTLETANKTISVSTNEARSPPNSETRRGRSKPRKQISNK